jgi:hypothetical protein
LAALIISVPKKAPFWASLPFVILSLPILFRIAGVRPQVITWLFFAFLIKVLVNNDYFQRFKFSLPFLFVVWTNLHGGFAAGLVVLAVAVFIRAWERKKIGLDNLVVLSFSVLATFINPYGPRIWVEIWNTFSSSLLHFTINEWIPTIYRTDFDYMILLTFSSLLVYWGWRKINKVKLGLFLLLLFAGISSVRNVPFWIFITLDLIAVLLPDLYQSIAKIKFAPQRFRLVFKIFCLVIAITVIWGFYPPVKSPLELKEEFYYPKGAVDYFKKNPPEGRVFAPYGWGGYLIWRLPEQKVFVDGRMAIWQRKSAPMGESLNAYKEFLEIDYGEKDSLSNLKKYQVRYVLWRKEDDRVELTDLEKITNLFVPIPPLPKRLSSQIQESGAELIYSDRVSRVYKLKY